MLIAMRFLKRGYDLEIVKVSNSKTTIQSSYRLDVVCLVFCPVGLSVIIVYDLLQHAQ